METFTIGGWPYRMETFTVSVDIYIAWRRLLYRIFISHGDVYCIGGYLYAETLTVSVNLYRMGRLLYRGGYLY
jgi:hypothetical protein